MFFLPSVNISTVEDPVEYNFKGMNQCQMKETIGFTFANALRALLRQDPDVILVGEIRDYETAEVAMKAALTGHMVLSTVHTNDAPSTIMRLKDMGIEPFTINSALRAVLAQRLVRKVCTKCAVPDERATPELLKKMGFPESAIGKIVVKRGQGCRHCRNTGNRGRMAIHEILVMNEKVREIIGQGASTDEIRAMAIKYGMRPMRTNCMRKVARGLVALEDLEDLGIW